jgi:GNAT superfamily N-acetyltransferase
MPFEIRKFEESDLASCVALYNAAETGDPDFVPLAEAEYRSRVLDSKQYDRDGHFVAMDGCAVVGEARGNYDAARTGPVKGVANFEIHLIPELLGTDAERELFAKTISRLRSFGAARIGTRVDTRHKARLGQMSRLGFVRNDYENHGMERPIYGAPSPVVPHGYRIRTALIPEEIPAMLVVVNGAFATRSGKMVIPMERFARQWGPSGTDDVSGTFVAERESDCAMVGIVVSQISRKHNAVHGTSRGGSYSLAVIPSERKKGVATALLLKSLEWIGLQGMDTAYLSVNVANPDALNIYLRAGYRTVQIYHGYSIEIV